MRTRLKTQLNILLFFPLLLSALSPHLLANTTPQPAPILLYKQVPEPTTAAAASTANRKPAQETEPLTPDSVTDLVDKIPSLTTSNTNAEEKAQLDEDTDSLLDPKKGHRIINVKHQLAMNNAEIGKTRKDFYINIGTKEGITPGTILNVYRHLPVFNEKGFYRYQDLSLEIGQLKVIDVQDKVTIARLQRLSTDSERPILDNNNILVGDRVALAE